MNGKKTLFSTIALSGAMVAGSAWAGLDADQPGSVLVYPVFEYTDNGSKSTQLRLTNVGNSEQWFRFVTVCGANADDPEVTDFLHRCKANDSDYKLTAKETLVIPVTDLNPPCTEGYVVAYPVDDVNDDGFTVKARSGKNIMIGSYLLTNTRPRRGMADQAIPIQYEGGFIGTEEERLLFNDSAYSRLPEVLWTDFRAIDFNPNKFTDLVLLTMDTWAGQFNYPTFASIDVWNEIEDKYSTTNLFYCWDRIRLDDMNTGFRKNNTTGQAGTGYGSMRIEAEDMEDFESETILGAIIERGADYYSVRNLYFEPEFESTTFVEN